MSVTSRLQEQLKPYTGDIFSGDGLKANVFRGGAWLGLGSVSQQVARFARNLILVRLLAPEAFGVMAIVISTTTLIHTITDIGIKDAIIQNRRGAEHHYVNGAFWLTLGRAALLFSVIVLLAPWVAHFYGNPELSPLLRVASFSILIDAAFSPRVYVDMKRLKFKKWAAINHGGSIIGVVITIILSFLMRDVWALVIGSLAESGAGLLLSQVFYPFLPRLTWDKEALKDLLHFSKGLAGLSLLNLVFARTDIFVLAKLYPAAELGLYVIAVYLVQVPVGFIMNLLGQTLMPALSHVQGDTFRENRILAQVSSALLILGMPALVFLYFCGHSLLTLFYGSRYGAASAALIVASWVSLINLLNGQITTVFYARGTPQLHRRCVAIMAIAMIALIYPSVKVFGLVGGQLACLAAVVIGYIFQLARIHHLTGLNLARYARPFVFGFAASLAVFVICFGARHFPAMEHPVLNIISGVFGCIAAYGFAAVFLIRGKEKIFV